ncbi:MAG: rRNA maturation RNase YbeY [Candidatus Omnitrophota bacterium]
MTSVHIYNQQTGLALSTEQYRRCVVKTLTFFDVRQADLSVVIVTDRKIQAINRRFLGHDHPTDVISFDLGDPYSKDGIEGEIYVSAVTARRNAREYRTSAEYELTLYMVHGILHLLGYDDHAPADIKTMRAKESEVMEYLGMPGQGK